MRLHLLAAWVVFSFLRARYFICFLEKATVQNSCIRAKTVQIKRMKNSLNYLACQKTVFNCCIKPLYPLICPSPTMHITEILHKHFPVVRFSHSSLSREVPYASGNLSKAVASGTTFINAHQHEQRLHNLARGE